MPTTRTFRLELDYPELPLVFVLWFPQLGGGGVSGESCDCCCDVMWSAPPCCWSISFTATVCGAAGLFPGRQAGCCVGRMIQAAGRLFFLLLLLLLLWNLLIRHSSHCTDVASAARPCSVSAAVKGWKRWNPLLRWWNSAHSWSNSDVSSQRPNQDLINSASVKWS